MLASTTKHKPRLLCAAAAAAIAMALALPAARAEQVAAHSGGHSPHGPAGKCMLPVWFGTLAGNWACQIEAPAGFLAPSPFVSVNHSKLPPSSPVRQLLQINIPKDCSPITGTLFHESGEGCNIPINDGSLALGPHDVGTLSLMLNIGMLPDEDNDLPCSALFGGRTSLSEKFHVVLSRAHGEMLLAGMEDFIAPAVGEGAELVVPVSGRCIRQ
jgi:hypothetical protein